MVSSEYVLWCSEKLSEEWSDDSVLSEKWLRPCGRGTVNSESWSSKQKLGDSELVSIRTGVIRLPKGGGNEYEKKSSLGGNAYRTNERFTTYSVTKSWRSKIGVNLISYRITCGLVNPALWECPTGWKSNEISGIKLSTRWVDEAHVTTVFKFWLYTLDHLVRYH